MIDDLNQYSYYLSGASNRRQLFEDKDSIIRLKNKQNDDIDVTFEGMILQEEDESYRTPKKVDNSPNVPAEFTYENVTSLQKQQSQFSPNNAVQFFCNQVIEQTYGPLPNQKSKIDQQNNNNNSFSEQKKLNVVWEKQFFSIFLIVYNVSRFLKMIKSKLYPEMFNRLAVDIIGDKSFDRSVLVSEKHRMNKNKSKKVLNRKICKCFNLIKLINEAASQLIQCLYIMKEKFDSFMVYLDEKIVPWDPLSTFVIFWEHFQLVCLTFVFFYIPFRSNVQFIDACEAIQQFLTIIFTFQFQINITIKNSDYMYIVFVGDILVKINTQFFYEGELIKSHQEIFLNYFKSQFITDMLAILVIVFPNKYFFSKEEFLFLILKMNSFLKIIDKIKENIFSVTNLELFNLFNLIMLDLFLGHLVACEWVALGLWQKNNGMDNWIDLSQRSSDKLISLYVKSLYFSIVTMNTVGYGDFIPKTDLERIVDLIVILVGCMLFGYSISKIGTILQTINKNREKLIQSMGGVNQYMKQNDLGLDIQNKVRKYLEYIHLKKDSEQISNDFISLLSKNLQREILINVQGSALKSVEIFVKNFSTEFLEDLALKVKQIYFSSDETITEEGQNIEDPSFYILNQGCIEISFRNTNCSVLKEKGEYFGQIEFFKMEHKSQYTIKSVGITSLFQIQLSDFINLIQSRPQEKEIFYQISHGVKNHQRYQTIISACRICCSLTHIEKNCHFVQYKPNMFKLIKSLHQIQSRSQCKFRTITKKFPTLLNQKKVEDALYDTDNDEELTEKETPTEKVGETKTDINTQKNKTNNNIKEEEEEDEDEDEYSSSSNSTIKNTTIKKSILNNLQGGGFYNENQSKNNKQNEKKVNVQFQGIKAPHDGEEIKVNSKVRFPSNEDLCQYEKPNHQQVSLTSIRQQKKKVSSIHKIASSMNEVSLESIESKEEQDEQDYTQTINNNQYNTETKTDYKRKKYDQSKSPQIINPNLNENIRDMSRSIDRSSEKSSKKYNQNQNIANQEQNQYMMSSERTNDSKKQDQNDQHYLLIQKIRQQQQEKQKINRSGTGLSISECKIDIVSSKYEQTSSQDTKSLNMNIYDNKNLQKKRKSSFFHLDPALKQLQQRHTDSHNQLARGTHSEINSQNIQIQNNQLEYQFDSLKSQLLQFLQQNVLNTQQQLQENKKRTSATPNQDEKPNSDNDIMIEDLYQSKNAYTKEESQLEDIGKDYKLYFPWNNKTIILQKINKLNAANNGIKQRIKQKLNTKIIKKLKK